MFKSYFYEDLLKDHEDRFKKKFYANSPFTLKVESNPDKNVKLWHQFEVKKEIKDEHL